MRAHLAQCARCREQLRQTRLAHAVFTSLSDMGLDEVRQRSLDPRPFLPPSRPAFPLLPIGSILAVTVLLLVTLFSPHVVTEVRASELLTRAVAQERTASEGHVYRLHVGSTACATKHRGKSFEQVANTEPCMRALANVRRSAWAEGNPLSANTFRIWRSSLPRHRDTIAHNPSGWTIETRSDAGLVRSARLSLHEPDLHPTDLKLRFDNDAELSVSEEVVFNEPAPTITASVAPVLPITHTDNPADLLEVRAWQSLFSLHADSGWEANILRSGPQVIVRAIAADDNRKKELQHGFAQLEGVEAHIQTAEESSGLVDFLPQRAFPAPGAALAEAWVQEHFHDPASQNAFKNSVVRSSRSLLGRALFVERLQQRHAALAACSCVSELSKLILSEQAELQTQQTALFADLSPLLDAAPPATTKPLSGRNARQLDLLVQELLISSGGSSDALEPSKSTLRALLGVTQNSSAPTT